MSQTLTDEGELRNAASQPAANNSTSKPANSTTWFVDMGPDCSWIIVDNVVNKQE